MAKKQKTSVSRNKEVYLTDKGLSNLREELDYLKNVKRAEISQKIQTAREYGDLSENSEYDAALSEGDLTENRILELEEIIKSAKMISAEHKSRDFVVIGSTVKIEMDNQIDEFTIVGSVEADPSKKRISNESPLGASLLGSKKGEEVMVTTSAVRYKCKVLEIR